MLISPSHLAPTVCVDKACICISQSYTTEHMETRLESSIINAIECIRYSTTAAAKQQPQRHHGHRHHHYHHDLNRQEPLPSPQPSAASSPAAPPPSSASRPPAPPPRPPVTTTISVIVATTSFGISVSKFLQVIDSLMIHFPILSLAVNQY